MNPFKTSQKSVFILLLFCTQFVLGQVVSTTQTFPSGDLEITIIFDLKQAKDSRAKGLLGKTDDVFLWSGAGSTDAATAFEFQPTGQSDFSKAFNPGKMTSLGNDVWSIKITPRAYYNVPATSGIKKLGLLLKNGAGNAQTEDFLLKLYDNSSLIAAIFKPTTKTQFVDANQTIKMLGRASQKCNLSFKVDNQAAVSANADSLNYDFNVGSQSSARRMVVFQAQTSTLTAADTAYFTVNPQPIIAALPANIKDGINYVNNTTVILSLFAPLKKFVYVIGEFNNWQSQPQYLMKRTPDGTRYWLEINNLVALQEYAFQYLVDGILPVGDPYCDKILDPNNDKTIPAGNYPSLKAYPAGATGIVSVLQTAQVPYPWKITNFKRPDADKLTIYELLVRDFSAGKNYKSVIDSLQYLKRLGINTLELMPIMEFTGNESWGYNPIYYQAPDKAYGTKNDLKALIDKCHENGIAVVLDMVLNQADYEFPYVKMYFDGSIPAANSPFFNQAAKHPYSVFFDFNHESQATKDLVDNICKYWIQEYKFDGYRFDLAKGFTQRVSTTDAAFSAYDASRVAIWKRIYDKIRGYDPTAYVILEHFADNQEEIELSSYGMMLWGNLNGDYRSVAAGNLRSIDGISSQKRGWTKRALVGYMESHDEQRLLYDLTQVGLSQGGYNIKTLPTALERAKLAAVFMLGVPGPKMIWQFGEFGYDVPLLEAGRTDKKPTKWEYTADPNRAKLLRVYQEMNKLRANTATDFDTDLGVNVKRITITNQGYNTFIVGNFDIQASNESLKFPSAGKWYDYFTGKELNITDPLARLPLQAGEFHIFTSIKLPTPEAGIVPWNGDLSAITATNPLIENEPLIVYPNPTKGQITIDWNSSEKGAILLEIIDLQGRIIGSKTSQKMQQKWSESWNLPVQINGSCIIRISTDKQTFSKKLKIE